MLMLAAVLACAGEKGDDALSLTDDNNYEYEAVITVSSATCESGEDIQIDWSALSVDIRGRTVDPAGVDQLALVAFGLSPDDVVTAIAGNTLRQSDVRDYRLYDNAAGGTSAQMSAFSVLGNPFVPADEFVERDAVWTWAALVQDEVAGRDDILTLLFLDPVVGGEGTAATIDDDSAILDFDATMGAALTAAEGVDYNLDWSGLSVEASGQPFDPLRADDLFVGHVPQETDAEIEAVFVQILDQADALYRLEVYGETGAALGDATDEDGASFPGFSTGGSWLVGLECTSCTSPAPVLLTRVVVE